jgi:hypothetical protein
VCPTCRKLCVWATAGVGCCSCWAGRGDNLTYDLLEETDSDKEGSAMHCEQSAPQDTYIHLACIMCRILRCEHRQVQLDRLHERAPERMIVPWLIGVYRHPPHNNVCNCTCKLRHGLASGLQVDAVDYLFVWRRTASGDLMHRAIAELSTAYMSSVGCFVHVSGPHCEGTKPLIVVMTFAIAAGIVRPGWDRVFQWCPIRHDRDE